MARKYFPTMAGTFRRLAAVVTSPIVRSALNLMVRLTGSEDDPPICLKIYVF